MTLQIKDVEIAGVPAIKVRNALRDVTQVNKDYLADRCKLSTRRAQQVIDALVKDGFLCPPHKEKELAGSYRPPEKFAKLLANPSSADRYSELVFGRR